MTITRSLLSFLVQLDYISRSCTSQLQYHSPNPGARLGLRRSLPHLI